MRRKLHRMKPKSKRKAIPAHVKVEVLIAQDDLCNICFEPLLTTADNIPLYDIDHIQRHAETQDDSLGNLQAICLNCHRIKTVHEARSSAVAVNLPKRRRRRQLQQQQRRTGTIFSKFAYIPDQTPNDKEDQRAEN